ncbi:MAG TPA: hypothetical protein VEY08_16665, partial [Chloroflexia bacterium]|nr:hypothetical protein [Chloroflexia bacterium]
MMGGKVYDEIYMDCLASEFERPVTPGKDWGLSAWSSPEVTTRIEVGAECWPHEHYHDSGHPGVASFRPGEHRERLL